MQKYEKKCCQAQIHSLVCVQLQDATPKQTKQNKPMKTQDMTAINYSDLAVQSMNAGDYLKASILWEKAGWESRGKQKRDFYFAKSKACKERTR
jgi:hypothetical protein